MGGCILRVFNEGFGSRKTSPFFFNYLPSFEGMFKGLIPIAGEGKPSKTSPNHCIYN